MEICITLSIADMPRQEAKKIISLNNVNRQEFSYTISLEIMNSMKEEFLKWINAWEIWER